MPDKEGSEDNKSTKSVVNKKQKQMMGEEGYDIARDMGKVSPSKDKKDATTMPVSKEMRKTQKKSKGPSAFELVKAKYGKSVMNGKKKANEELDLTKVAEAFGGYIVEAPVDPKKKNIKKTDAKEINKRLSAATTKGDQARSQYDADGGVGDSNVGDATQNKSFSDKKIGTVKPGEREATEKLLKDKQDDVIKQGEVVKRAKTFQRSFGTPTGADPQTGKPTYRPSTIETQRKPTMSNLNFSTKKLAPDTDMPKSRTGGVPTGDQYEKASKKLGDRQKARDTYLDPKTNKASPEGIKKYISKARQMRTGSNEPVDSKTTDVIATSAGKEYGDKINQKYGGRRVKLAQKEREPLSDYEKFQRKLTQARNLPPEERSKVNKKLADIPDDPRLKAFKKENPSTTAQFIAKPQSVVGATGGLLAKTFNPALAGTEAMQRYREGRKGDAAISALQALGGPIGFGAGVVNYIKNRTAISQQTAPVETQPKTEQKPPREVSKKTQPDVKVGSGGGKEPPKKKTTTQPAGDGGDKTPKQDNKPIDASVQKGIDYQIAKDVTDNARKTLGKIFNPKNIQTKKRTRTGRRSAG